MYDWLTFGGLSHLGSDDGNAAELLYPKWCMSGVSRKWLITMGAGQLSSGMVLKVGALI